MNRHLGTLLSAAILTAGSCDECGGGGTSSGGGGGGGQWLVGAGGLMLRIDGAGPGPVGTYPLRTKIDLLGIVCRGNTAAWVVGRQGTIFHTDDGGETWQDVSLPIPNALRGVAMSHADIGYVVGEDGAFYRTSDGGGHWAPADGPATSWTSIATIRGGAVALVGAADGSLWRYETGGERWTSVVEAGGPAIFAVAAEDNYQTAVAVGARGLMKRSVDGGHTWKNVNLGTTRDLADVWLTQEGGERAIAVGQAGVVVDVRWSAEPHIDELLPAELSLRGIHMQADGHGVVVGDGGHVFHTGDGGATWLRMDVGDGRNIYAVDALRGAGHL